MLFGEEGERAAALCFLGNEPFLFERLDVVVDGAEGAKAEVLLNVAIARTMFLFGDIAFDKIDNFSLPFREPFHIVTIYMRNKILVVESDAEAREQLEQMLQEVLEAGGELFFTQNREDALAIIAKEQPAIVFLDPRLVGGDLAVWKREGVHLVVTGEAKRDGADFLARPFEVEQVVEKCHLYLSAEPVPPILPM